METTGLSPSPNRAEEAKERPPAGPNRKIPDRMTLPIEPTCK
jgi:hypothetical protein